MSYRTRPSVTHLNGAVCMCDSTRTICSKVPVPEKMVAAVLTLLTSRKHVQPDDQLLHLVLQNSGANKVIGGLLKITSDQV